MSRDILNRPTALEQLLGGCPAPSREEWAITWNSMDALSKAVYITQAENIDDLPEDKALHRYMKAIREYLLADGLLDPNAQTLRETAAEMEMNMVEH